MFYVIYVPSYSYSEKSSKWLIENNIESIEVFENLDLHIKSSNIFFLTEEQCLLYKLSDIDTFLKIYEVEDDECRDIIEANTTATKIYFDICDKQQIYDSYKKILYECNQLKYCNIDSNVFYNISNLDMLLSKEVFDYNNSQNMFFSLMTIVFNFTNKNP